MTVFLVGIAVLGLGYVFYGRFVASTVCPDPTRITPAIRLADGIDYVEMSTWRIDPIQLLNIAGLGPVFGPILGALWGPQVFLWVVFGAILGGAVHDFLSGAMSMRHDGLGLPDLVGLDLGKVVRHVSTIFILVLMVFVGTVFVKGPAKLLVEILPAATAGGWLGQGTVEFLESSFYGQSVWLWVVMMIIFLYYAAATLLPIDKIIGRIYPFFAAALLIMVAGLAWAIVSGRIEAQPFSFANLHPKGIPAWPIIFITVSCGAISGFHATQSPLMARCMKSERSMRFVFYGAMIAEAVIALVWAAAAGGYYGGVEGLAAALTHGPSFVVHDVCTGTMGTVGGILAILGVVVLPITSGDTAFRVGRLIAADYLGLPQKRKLNRYLIALPLFAVSLSLNFISFDVIWRYFGWANQSLAAVTLWAAAVFLARRGSHWWIAALPAAFMTVMTTTFLLVEERKNGCLGLGHGLGTTIGLGLGAVCFAAFLFMLPKMRRERESKQAEIPPAGPLKVG